MCIVRSKSSCNTCITPHATHLSQMIGRGLQPSTLQFCSKFFMTVQGPQPYECARLVANIAAESETASPVILDRQQEVTSQHLSGPQCSQSDSPTPLMPAVWARSAHLSSTRNACVQIARSGNPAHFWRCFMNESSRTLGVQNRQGRPACQWWASWTPAVRLDTVIPVCALRLLRRRPNMQKGCN